MGPGNRNRQQVQKAKDFKGTIKKLFKYFQPFKIGLLIALIAAVAGVAFTVFAPQLIGDMTNVLVEGLSVSSTGASFSPDLGDIARLGWVLIGLYAFSALFGYLQSWIMSEISQRITFTLRRQLSQKIAKLPLTYFDKTETGDIVSIVTNDLEIVGQNLSQSLVQIITSIITIVGVSVMMLRISWEMTLVAAIIVPISTILIGLIMKFSQKYFSDLQREIGRINGHVEEILSSHEIMKAYNGEGRSITTFNKINENVFKNAWFSQFFGGMTMPMMSFIRRIGDVIVTVIGGIRAINGQISIGDILAFTRHMGNFTQPLTQVASSMTVVQSTVAAAERVFAFLEAEEQVEDKVSDSLPAKIKGAVEFKDVNFSYKAGEPVIANFNAQIKPRQSVAIVGPTGAGKTTLVNLLMRFYEVDSGEITIDGIDIVNLSREELRGQFGMVLQDTWLFNGTIAENLSYGKPEATREQIIAAAKAAHADHFIRTMPEGYDTIISEDVDNISAGEKQLLTIARAILADASMMILDEATSSVDTRTEAAIQSAMDKLTHGRTSFVIAHRLSTIRSADLILVMDKGNVAEQGTHDELIKLGGQYAKLYESQFAES